MTTPVDIKVGIQSEETLRKVGGVVNDVAKTVSTLDGSFARYEKSLKSLLTQLQQISRTGAPVNQTVKDLQMMAGGTSVAGRVRQAGAKAQISDMKQIEQALAANLVNAQRQILRDVSKSVQSALVKDYARMRQTTIASDMESLRAQIEAQTARTTLAGQLSGTRGLNRGRLQQNASALGVDNLGTLRQEQAALNNLLAAEQRLTAENRNQLADARALLGIEERMKRITDDRFATLRNQSRILQLGSMIGRQDVSAAQAAANGNQMGVLNANAKKEALRLEQMILQGVKEESAQYQQQLGVIRGIVNEKEKLRAAQGKITADAREQTALERSQRFRDGDPTMRQTTLNNMVGARQAAGSTEGRASLLGLQGNLLMNYALIGSVTSALTGMTSAVVELDAQMRQLQAISGATNAEYLKMRSAILEASTDTKFSAVELAEGATLLAQVGLSAQQIQQVLPVVSNFAMAVGTDMKTAVDITTTALTVFNMSVGEAQRVTNVMTEALNRSKLSMDQLTLGFQYAANITADAGGTFEELTAVLAGMSQAGIRSGSMLGTGLRQIMISLASPTEEVSQLLKDLGLTMNDVDIRTQGVVGVLENFREAGITAGQAMGAFETRTAAALIAATNQVDFMRQLQEAYIYTNAAEEASRVQKDALKNSVLELKNEFLAFMNGAAMPIIGVLVATAQAFSRLGEILTPISPVLQLITSAMIGLIGVAMVASIGKLVVAFVQFSGVLSGMPAILTTVRTYMTAYTAQVGLVAAAQGTAAAATWGFRAALSALAAHPVALALMATVGVLGLLTNGFGMGTSAAEKNAQKMDELKTEYDESQARLTNYQEVLGQVDATLERLSARSTTLKSDKEALRIEVLQAGIQFNQYGASIRDTTIDLNGLTDSLYRARQGVLDLMYAEAQRSGNAAARSAAEASAQTSQQLSGLIRTNLGGDTSAAALMRARPGLGRREAEQLSRDIAFLKSNPRATDQDSSFRISTAASNVERHFRSMASQAQPGFRQNMTTNAANRVGDLASSALRSGQQYSIEQTARTQEMTAAARRTTRVQRLEQSLVPNLTAGQFNEQLGQIETLRRTNPREAQRQEEALYRAYRQSNEVSQTALNNIDRIIADPSTDAGTRMALQEIRNGNRGIGETTTAARTAARARDTADTEALGTLERALKGRSDFGQIQAAAAQAGIVLPNDRTAALRYVQDRKAAASTGFGADQRLGTNSALTALNYGMESLANRGGPGPRGAGGSSGAGAAEKAAKDAKRLNDAAASSFNRLSEASEKSAELILKDIDRNTSPEQLETILTKANEDFKSAETYQTQYYDTKLEGLKEYRDKLIEIGSLSASELADMNAEILNTQLEAEAAAKNSASEINDKMVAALQKIPAIGKPFSTLLDTMDRLLGGLAIELEEALALIRQLEASRQESSTYMGVLQRQGVVGSARAGALDGRYQRSLDARAGQALDDRLSNLRGRQAALGNTLSGNAGTVNGEVIPLADTERALNNARTVLGTLETGTVEYAKQSAIVKDLEAVNDRVVAARQTLLETEREIDGILDAQADRMELQNQTIGQAIQMVAEQWGQDNGWGKSGVEGLLDGIPQVLTTANNAFSTFFSDVLSGTASVGDAFRTMAGSILDAMMDVVASEIAKSFVKLLFSVGRNLMGGGGGPDPSLDGLYKDGGFVRAATGKAVRGRDSVPILAMPGEFVLRKSAVDAIGADNLQSLNANGNRAISGQNAVKPVTVAAPQQEQRPMNIYVVSPDKTPPPSRDEIIVMIQEDMINRGPVYKTTKAIQQGAI